MAITPPITNVIGSGLMFRDGHPANVGYPDGPWKGLYFHPLFKRRETNKQDLYSLQMGVFAIRKDLTRLDLIRT